MPRWPLRNATAARVALRYWLPVSEVSHLLLANLHWKEGYCLVDGKGSKQRMVPIGSRAKQAIADYLADSRPN